MKKRTELIAARIDKSLADRVRNLARKQDRTVSQVVRTLLESWTKARGKAA